MSSESVQYQEILEEHVTFIELYTQRIITFVTIVDVILQDRF